MRVWDLKTFQVLQTLQGHRSSVPLGLWTGSTVP